MCRNSGLRYQSDTFTAKASKHRNLHSLNPEVKKMWQSQLDLLTNSRDNKAFESSKRSLTAQLQVADVALSNFFFNTEGTPWHQLCTPHSTAYHPMAILSFACCRSLSCIDMLVAHDVSQCSGGNDQATNANCLTLAILASLGQLLVILRANPHQPSSSSRATSARRPKQEIHGRFPLMRARCIQQ